jgi:hypothetical protein
MPKFGSALEDDAACGGRACQPDTVLNQLVEVATNKQWTTYERGGVGKQKKAQA